MATDPEGIMPPEYKDKVAAGIWGWIGNNDALTIDGVHIIDIITDPEQYGALTPGTPDYDEWVFGLLAQTEYYQNNREDRAERDLEWYTEGQHEAWSERRRSLVETELDLIEGFIAEAQLDWTDDQILQAAKQFNYFNPELTAEQDNWEEVNHAALLENISNLDRRSQDIIRARWLEDNKLTLNELADKYSVSAERIRQIEAKAFKQLKTALVNV